jgi:20S proteasome alpha/beta subunit
MLNLVPIRYSSESSEPSGGFMRVDAVCYGGQRSAKMGLEKKTKKQKTKKKTEISLQ